MTKKKKSELEAEILKELSIQKALAKCGISPTEYYTELSKSLEFREHFSKLMKVSNIMIFDKLNELARKGSNSDTKLYIEKVEEFSREFFKASNDSDNTDIQLNTMVFLAVTKSVKKYGVDKFMNHLSKIK